MQSIFLDMSKASTEGACCIQIRNWSWKGGMLLGWNLMYIFLFIYFSCISLFYYLIMDVWELEGLEDKGEWEGGLIAVVGIEREKKEEGDVKDYFDYTDFFDCWRLAEGHGDVGVAKGHGNEEDGGAGEWGSD